MTSMLKSFPDFHDSHFGFLRLEDKDRSPLLTTDLPVRGTSWSFHQVFGFGLLSGVLLAVLIVVLWRCYVKPGKKSQTTSGDSQSSSSWEPQASEPHAADLEAP